VCGIAGIVGARAGTEAIDTMIERLHHRGPDDRGRWEAPGVSLGHTRLAILDLSPAGHQPMVLDDYVITYNGEIYNFEELRASLPGPFVSTSDTEVLLHLYREYGDRCVEHLHGMFAFAIWDQRRQRLFAARDRLGIKPFHYRADDAGFAFASELNALVDGAPLTVDRDAITDFLTYGYVPAPRTVYSEVRKLPPAHTLIWESGTVRLARYWEPSAEIRITDPHDAQQCLDELLGRVVPEQTIADVPVGVFLSGGLDSALVSYYAGNVTTFTLDFDLADRSELDAARAVATHLGVPHQFDTARGADVDAALDILTTVYGEPFADSAAWSAYLVCQLARRHVTVALSGDGGDEVFCGYSRYWKGVGPRSNFATRALAAWLPPLGRPGYMMQRRALTGLEGHQILMGGFTPRQLDELLHPHYRQRRDDDLWFYRQYWRDDLPPLQRMRWLDLHTNLPERMLVKVDRASMAHSLEVRPPLLDHRLVELALSISPQVFVNHDAKRGKQVLRDLMAPRLPPGHLDRPKRGFGLPVRRWLQRSPDVVEDASKRLIEAGILKKPLSAGLSRVWFLLILDRWLQAH
jgi:asparagine synthase (glutamine-hydrolysing)